MSRHSKIRSRRLRTKKRAIVSKDKAPDIYPVKSSPTDEVLHLQNTAGNETVQRMFDSGIIQPKLKIGQPGDKYELEADRMAEQVMRMPDSVCPGCTEKKEESIQSAVENSATMEMSPDVESGINSLKGSGQPLSEATRNYFEPRFGYDFSAVRIHTGNEANDTAKLINARSFTFGNDIVFGTSNYSPKTSEGKKLLAHELTHVIQQSSKTKFFNIRQIKRSNLKTSSVVQRQEKKETDSFKGSWCLPHKVQSGNLLGQIFFPTNEYAVYEKHAVDALAKYVDAVKKCLPKDQKTWVTFAGFADRRGSSEYNYDLALKRALSCKGYVDSNLYSYSTSVNSNAISLGRQPGPGLKDSELAGYRRVDIIGPAIPKCKKTKPSKSNWICGPDVTKALADAVSKIKRKYASWSRWERFQACDDLIAPDIGRVAWDIVEMYDKRWVNKPPYSPPCVAPNCPGIGNQESRPECCSNSVTVNNMCFYAGSPNYVSFGIMCKCCGYSKSFMLAMIDAWKGPVPYVRGAASNWVPSRDWAEIGYDGWSGGSVSARTTKLICDPCGKKYVGPPFMVRWSPHGTF